MRILSLFTILAVQASADSSHFRKATKEHKKDFFNYAAKFNRNYDSLDEFDSRFGLYLKTKQMIDNAPPSTFEMELNHFADRSDAEKQALLTL